MTPPTADSCNLYAGDDALSRLRRRNLSVYLSEMQRLKPEVMLVGEAPGVHGCYLTGIPFIAEWRLLYWLPVCCADAACRIPAGERSWGSTEILRKSALLKI